MAKEVVDFMEGVVDKGKEQVAMEVTLTNCPRDFVTIDASLPEDEMRKKRRKLFGEGQIFGPQRKEEWRGEGGNHLEKENQCNGAVDWRLSDS